MRRLRRSTAAAAGCLLLVAAAGCGGDDDDKSTTTVGEVSVDDAGASEGRVRLGGGADVGDTASSTTSMTIGLAFALPGEDSTDVTIGLTLLADVAVTAVADDGGYTTQQTVQSVSIDEAPDGVDLDELESQYEALQGVVIEQVYDANGVAGDSQIVGADDLDDDARQAAEELEESSSTATITFPDEEVGVGATWSTTQTTTKQGFELEVTYEYELTELDGDTYVVTTNYDDDIDQDVTSDGTSFDVTGSISGTGTTTGSLTNPLVSSGAVDQTLDLDLENDGDSASMNATYHVEFDNA